MKHVYFMKPVGMDGPIKIGCSDTPKERLINLAIWSPWPLELICAVPGDGKDERFAHSCFFDCHSHREWFHSTPTLRAAIAAVAEAGTMEPIRAMTPKGNIRGTYKKRSEESKRCQSYKFRCRRVEQKLREKVGNQGAWCVPKDVEQILSKWIGYRRPNQPPTPAEYARLDQYLSDPAAHSVLSPFFLQRKAA